MVIALAVRATGLTAAPRPAVEVLRTFYVAPKPDPTPPAAAAPRRPLADAGMPAVPQRPDVPTVVMPDVPTTLPEAGSIAPPSELAFDSTPVSAAGQRSTSPNVSDGSPFTRDLVENAVVAIPGTATPRYPSMLQSAGVEGDVRTQFVVDTLGHVEKESVKVLETGHEQFAAAVREALSRARFSPAEVGGRKVRQLVEQTFTFRIRN